MSELYDHDDICPGRPDCGHCQNCGESFKGEHCPCEYCPCCGDLRCGCSIQDNVEYSDPETGYRDFVSFCTVCRKVVD